MLCISIAPESRRLGKVDLFNAAPQCDLIEFRLDRLGKEPDLKEMMQGIEKPLLISCRRASELGSYRGSEEERLLQLRAAVAAGPAYVELELDVAANIPRYGTTKRVVSFTTIERTTADFEPIIEQAVSAAADVVKLVGMTTSLEESWPMLVAITKKRSTSVVGVGIGAAGVTVALIGRKHGAPWTYASLERGMEAYPGQATVSEFRETWCYDEIGSKTLFIPVTGFGPATRTVGSALNKLFQSKSLNARALPVELAYTGRTRWMLDTLHMKVLLAGPAAGERATALGEVFDDAAREARYCDLLLRQFDGWHGRGSFANSALAAIERRLRAKSSDDHSLERRTTLVIGSGGLARALVREAARRKGRVCIAAANDDEAQHIATKSGARFIPHASLYDTLCDVVLITDARHAEAGAAKQSGAGIPLNPSFLKPPMLVTDLSSLVGGTELLLEARMRGCTVVEPTEILIDYLTSIFKAISGHDADASIVRQAVVESLK
jgi:3-dehydroquinate dehydratase / shikimate dehydrogenase